MSTPNVKEVVQEKYGQAALRVTSGAGNPCCRDDSSALEGSCDPITSNLYDAAQEGEVPDTALKASLGCGNPTALAELKPGEVVLDLGSGGGVDVLLSARRVGSTGKAYGLDMTDEMLALAEENKHKSGLANVEFLKGEIENIPLPDNTCGCHYLQLRHQPFRRQGPRVQRGVSGAQTGRPLCRLRLVVRGNVPAEIKKNMELWVGCVAGALNDYEYVAKLAKAGFDNIDIEATRVYNIEDARVFLSNRGLDVEEIAKELDGKFISAFVRATKPATACCAPGCCSTNTL